MKPMLLRDIATAIGAEYNGDADALVAAISTDTRELPPGCLFVALEGEKYDGNDYVARALEHGAAWVVASRMPEGTAANRTLLANNGREALLRIANLYRRSLSVKVIGITGSVGKTTTKEMVACVTGAGFSTLKTPQNLNNEVGLSKTILRLEETHQVAVLEMGMDGPGQMAPLGRCAEPDIAILTNIGVSHLQQLGSREGILREKLDITVAMGKEGVVILNMDNDMLAGVKDLPQRVLRYGLDGDNLDARAEEIKAYSTYTTFVLLYNKRRYAAKLPCLGRHNVGNALAAFLAGVTLGMQPEDAVKALESYQAEGMRQKAVEHSGFTVVEDCYNASPDSMRAALHTLKGLECSGKKIAVFSDMLELGEIEVEAHREVGRLATDSADMLLCTGPLSRHCLEGAREAGMDSAWHFPSQQELFHRLKQVLKAGDIVWFKASRGMHLEETIENVYKEC